MDYKPSIRSIQSLSCVLLFATPRTAARQASLSITNSQSLLKLMSIESVMPSNLLILCRPRLLLSSIFPSIRVFSNESVLLIRWPKYWSLSFCISPWNEYSRLISFRIDWLALLAGQGTLKSLLQHHSSKVSIPSHPYMTTRKTIALTRRNFVDKVMSLLFSMLSSWLEEAMAPHSSTLAWKIPWMEEPGRFQSLGSLRVGHDWVTSLSLFTFMHWRRKWQPTPVLLPGES